MTRAGRYEGCIELGRSALGLRVLVPEDKTLSLYPERSFVQGHAGSKVPLHLIMHNQGNTEIKLERRYGGFLEPENRRCRVLRAAAAEVEDERSGRDAVWRAGARSVREDRDLALCFEEQPPALAPDEVRLSGLGCIIPKGTEPGRYSAVLQIANRRIVVRVECLSKRREGGKETQ
ncbi:MAG: hypothetical protein OER77_09115 [Myxococcales bacterium]|nr:hypothetical protein [Myxococcales bacterium]